MCGVGPRAVLNDHGRSLLFPSTHAGEGRVGGNANGRSEEPRLSLADEGRALS
jgi:hypothetical protein